MSVESDGTAYGAGGSLCEDLEVYVVYFMADFLVFRISLPCAGCTRDRQRMLGGGLCELRRLQRACVSSPYL